MVEVDWPMKVLYMHIQLYREKWLSSHRCHFVKNTFSAKLLHAYVQYVYIVTIKHWINLLKAMEGVDRSTKTLSITGMHNQKHIKEKLTKFS